MLYALQEITVSRNQQIPQTQSWLGTSPRTAATMESQVEHDALRPPPTPTTTDPPLCHTQPS